MDGFQPQHMLESQAQDPEIEAQLNDFAQKIDRYAQVCEQYRAGSLSLSDITRELGEAATDAEVFFGEQSHRMGMDQLQRFALLQNRLDTLTVQVFESEITNNQATILAAIEHGDYFIVNLTYNAIKSSIHMIYSKQKIKTQQEQRLAETQQELEVAQTFIKVLKALESVLNPESGQLEWPKIERAVSIYRDYFLSAPAIPLKHASDQRLFGLFAAHASRLVQQQLPGWEAHLERVRAILLPLAVAPGQAALMAAWEGQFGHQAVTAPAVEFAEPVVPAAAPAGTGLLEQLEQLGRRLQVVMVSELNFAALEAELAGFATALRATGVQADAMTAHRVFTLFESYFDFLCNVDFTQDPGSAAAHVVRCCDSLSALAQTPYQGQMLETWRATPVSLSILCKTKPAEA